MEVVAVGSVELFGSGPIEKALRTTPVLAVDPDCSSHQVLVDALRERYGIDPPVIEAGSVGGARELVRSGYGIAMLPQDRGRLGGVGSGLAVIPGLPWVKLGVRVLWTGREMATPAAVAVHGLTLRVF
jgi:DNA-binding transcriptional LysR family regulator